MKINVAVIFGGETVEHEISVISALQAIKNFNRDKYNIYPIYISKEGVWYYSDNLKDIKLYKDLERVKKISKKVVLYKTEKDVVLRNLESAFNKNLAIIDVAFPIVHGNNVEDGTLCGYLKMLGIPYVGSNILASSLGQDKIIQKQLFEQNNIPIVKYVAFNDFEFMDDSDKILARIKKMGYPVVVKPATLGSSVGISYVNEESFVSVAIKDAISYDNKIIVEKAVKNLKEVNISVLGSEEEQRVSEIEEVTGSKDILSYQDKYQSGGVKENGSKGMASADRIIPARIDKSLEEKISNTAKDVFKVLNMNGVCRIDFLIDSKTNEYFVNEPNIIPGSLAFYLWEASGLKYKELLDELISLAIKRYKNNEKKINSFNTNVLSNFNGTKSIKK